MAGAADLQPFRTDLREYVERELDPVVDERDREPFTRSELLGYLADLRELGVGFDPETAEAYFGDLRRYTCCCEELSRVWPSLTVSLNMSFPALFVQHASEETRAAMASKLRAGECIGCLAVTEPAGGSDTARPRTTARRDGDEFVIDGEKTWVGNAQISDVALVVARDESEDAQDMFLVDRENADYETEPLDKLGWKAVPNARLELDGVRVPADNRLSTMFRNAVMDGADVADIVPFPESVSQLFMDQKPLNATFSFMRTGMAFMAVGIMQAAFDESLAYARERETFGDPIGKHQLVQEKLYDMKCNLESSRWLAHRVVDLLEDGDPESRLMSSLAKGYTSERAVETTADAVQVHGAAGLDTDNRLERYYRDAKTLTIPDGTTEIQKLIVGKELTGMAAY